MSKCTITITDKETGKTLMDIDVDKASLEYSVQKIHNNVEIKLLATGFLAEEEKSIPIHNIDEDGICPHYWIDYSGLSLYHKLCRICGNLE